MVKVKYSSVSIMVILALLVSMLAVLLPVAPASAAVTAVAINSPTTAAKIYISTGSTPGQVDVNYTLTDGAGPNSNTVTVLLLQGGVTKSTGTASAVSSPGTYDIYVSTLGLAAGSYDVVVQSQPTGGGSIVNSPTQTGAVVISATPITASLVHPNGGEFLSANTAYTVSWNATSLNAGSLTINADYSTDGGATYGNVAWGAGPNTQGSGSHAWTTPNSDQGTAKIRLTIVDSAGNSLQVASASNFDILRTVSVSSISSPNAASSWNGNSAQTITFFTNSAFGLNIDYKIDLSVTGGTPWNIPVTGWVTNVAPGTTNYPWANVYNAYRGNLAQILVTVRDHASPTPNTATLASASFTINDVTPPSVTVTTPAGGAKVYNGISTNVIFNANDNIAGTLTNHYYFSTDGGTTYTEISGSPSTDAQGNGITKSWTPSVSASSTNCKIKVTSTDGATVPNTGTAYSGTFSIILPSVTGPSVNITSPAGGETWQEGSTQTITWTGNDTSDPTARLQYDLYLATNGSTFPGTPFATFTNQVQGSKSLSWAVASGGVFTTTNKIKIIATNPGYVSPTGTATSNAFTITAADFGVTTADITLASGWNLISLPLIPTNTAIENVLATCIGGVQSVWSYSGGPSGSWISYAPGAPPALTTMSDGKGYWIKVSSSGGPYHLIFQGRQGVAPPAVPPTYNVVAGWNLIGYKSTVSTHSVQQYLGATNYNLPLTYFTGGSYGSVNGLTDTLTTKLGYWVYFNAAGSFTPPSD
ncbi:MAG: hypothetical protein ACYDHZ_07240 [Dehalococcoidia bacterium]